MTLPFDINDPVTYPPVGSPMWHLHHEELLEWLTEPLINRVEYVRAAKPAAEIETRLRWMKPVLGTLPAPVVKAWAAYGKAWAAYGKARAAYDKATAAYEQAWAAYGKAWAAYGKARAAYEQARAMPAIEGLHIIEHPGCPWNGRTIFPEGTP